jgi:hypothetical protein
MAVTASFSLRTVYHRTTGYANGIMAIEAAYPESPLKKEPWQTYAAGCGMTNPSQKGGDPVTIWLRLDQLNMS